MVKFSFKKINGDVVYISVVYIPASNSLNIVTHLIIGDHWRSEQRVWAQL